MNHIPDGAEYYYNDTYYKRGNYYAKYWAREMWNESAKMTNVNLMKVGFKVIRSK